MVTQVRSLGAVVLGQCSKAIDGVCMFPDRPGPLLVFKDESGQQIDVCKRCADRSFETREWVVLGQPGDSADSGLDRARKVMVTSGAAALISDSAASVEKTLRDAAFADARREAEGPDDVILVDARHVRAAERRVLRIPLRRAGFWRTVKIFLNLLGSISLAISLSTLTGTAMAVAVSASVASFVAGLTLEWKGY